MSFWSFGSFLFALGTIALTALLFLLATRPRSARLKSILARLCLQLAADQHRAPLDGEFDDVRHLLDRDTQALSALEFLDDPARQSLLDHIGKVSLSLFVAPVIRMLGIGSAVAFVTAPLIMGIGSLMPPFNGYIDSFVKNVPDSIAILVGMSAGGGVLLCLFMMMVFWRVSFGRDLATTAVIIESQPLWTPGRTRRPEGRKLVEARSDAAFSQLFK